MKGYVDVQTASNLTGEAPQRVREKIDAGTYKVATQSGGRGGKGGESYLIETATLPMQAQIMYMLYNGHINGPVSDQCDLAGYHAKYGEAGMQELLTRQRATLNALAIRRSGGADVTQRLTQLADDYGVNMRTLYRWMDGYEARGLSGVMRAMARSDKGKFESMCPAAYQYAYGLYAAEVKRTQSTIYRKLCVKAAELGPDACRKCIFEEGTTARKELVLSGKAGEYPPCEEPQKNGMRVPACRQTLSRILSSIPNDELTLARRGVAAWKNEHMVMATREKPQEVNRVWFGDHHQFDAFVLDETGKAIRPWLTAWYDAATGCLVGWVLSTNPNTETITEAFIRGVAHTQHGPFFGLPAEIYIDNGRDYRSRTFELGIPGEKNIGRLNERIEECSVIQLFNIRVHHAVPYHAWSKSIERFFGTLEGIWIREVPGWCGNSPEKRPEEFSRDLKRHIERGSLWTMDQLYAYLRDTAFAEYHDMPHEGHGGKAPLELYGSLPRARDEQPSWDMLSVARLNMEQRKVSQSGIKFKNRLYWDDALMGMAGEMVTIRYSNSDLYSITIMHEGRYLCEAIGKATIALIGADEAQLQEHMAKQKRQLRDVRERVKRASRNVFADDVDTRQAAGNITSLEYKKAARGRAQVQEDAKRAKEKPASDDPFRRKLRAMGDSVLGKDGTR